MVLILLSIIFAAIAIAISRVRHRIRFGGDLSSIGERSEQLRITSPVKPFLVVVLPDGTIVNRYVNSGATGVAVRLFSREPAVL